MFHVPTGFRAPKTVTEVPGLPLALKLDFATCEENQAGGRYKTGTPVKRRIALSKLSCENSSVSSTSPSPGVLNDAQEPRYWIRGLVLSTCCVAPDTVVQPHEKAKMNVRVLRSSSAIHMVERVEVQQGYGGVSMSSPCCGEYLVI